MKAGRATRTKTFSPLIASVAFFLANAALATSTSQTTEIAAAEWQKLTQQHQSAWSALLHFYGARVSTRSSILNPDFFFAGNGANDAADEWRATAEKFQTADLHERIKAICRYPARAKFYRKLNLLSSVIPNESMWSEYPECADWLHFKDQVRATYVSVVFASAYLGNPSSSYGHVFLRLGRQRKIEIHESRTMKLQPNGLAVREDEPSDEFDLSIGLNAEREGHSALAFLWKGFFGGLDGRQQSAPYYLKLNEYHDIEARDLFEYRLNLSPDEVELLVAHLWETRNLRFQYTFYNQNCARFVMELLQAAAPRLKALDWIKLSVVPTDTLRVLRPNTETILFRKSKASALVENYQLLTSDQRQLFSKTIADIQDEGSDREDLDRTMEAVPEAQVFRLLLTYYDLIKANANEREIEGLKKVLLKVSRTVKHSAKPKDPATPKDSAGLTGTNSPQVAHGAARFAVGYSWDDAGSDRLLVDYRFAYHDRTDPSAGFRPDFSMEFLKLSTGYVLRAIDDDKTTAGGTRAKQIQLEHAYILKAQSLPRWQQPRPHLSYQIHIGGERAYWSDVPTESTWNQGLRLGIGQTWGHDFFGRRTSLDLSFLGNAHVFDRERGEFASGKPHQQFLSLSPELSALLRYADQFSFEFNLGYERALTKRQIDRTFTRSVLRWHLGRAPQSNSLEVQYKTEQSHVMTSIKWLYYF